MFLREKGATVVGIAKNRNLTAQACRAACSQMIYLDAPNVRKASVLTPAAAARTANALTRAEQQRRKILAAVWNVCRGDASNSVTVRQMGKYLKAVGIDFKANGQAVLGFSSAMEFFKSAPELFDLRINESPATVRCRPALGFEIERFVAASSVGRSSPCEQSQPRP